MKSLWRFGLASAFSVSIAMMSACGGGSSSSGVGKSAAGVAAGRYAGFGDVTFVAPGVAPLRSQIVIIVVINPDNTVILDPETPIPGTGTITGNIITAAYPATIANSPGISCTGLFAVNGILTAGTITGNIGPSTVYCNGIPITASGTYTVSRVPTTVPGPGPVQTPGGYRSQGNTLGSVLKDSARITVP